MGTEVGKYKALLEHFLMVAIICNSIDFGNVNCKGTRVLKSGVVLEIGCKRKIFAARVAVNRKRVLLGSHFVLSVQGNKQLLLLMNQCQLKVLFSISLFGMLFQELIIIILLIFW